jgi:hypothetical protein
VERHAEPLEVVAELGDVVAVDQVVGVGVEQVDGGPAQHERHLVLAGDHADADPHRLERAVRGPRVGRDQHEDGLLVGHGGGIS